jgi:hypothetical protein
MNSLSEPAGALYVYMYSTNSKIYKISEWRQIFHYIYDSKMNVIMFVSPTYIIHNIITAVLYQWHLCMYVCIAIIPLMLTAKILVSDMQRAQKFFS